MKNGEKAVEAFKNWLPNELTYSAGKAGYDRKVERAKLPAENRQSIQGFLSTEWFNYQRLKRDGAHHVPHHGMSAQLQLAKFAAGLFDKVGVAKWLASHTVATEAAFTGIAHETAVQVLQRSPWEQNATSLNFADSPFEETPFAEGVHSIMSAIVLIENTHDAERARACRVLAETSMDVGGLAVRCYQQYAEEYLKPDQLVLPVSAILLEKFIEKYSGQLTLTKDAVDYITANPKSVKTRSHTLLVLSFAQLQKLAVALQFPQAFTYSMDLIRLVETLHKLTSEYPFSIVTKHLDQLVCAVNGQVSTTPSDQKVWRVKTAGSASTWWLQNPEKPFEALTTSCV